MNREDLQGQLFLCEEEGVRGRSVSKRIPVVSSKIQITTLYS